MSDVEDAQAVGAPPVDDLAPDLQVEVVEQAALDPHLLEVHLPLVLVEHLSRVVVAAVGEVGPVVESEARDAPLPLERQVDVELEIEPRAQPLEPAVVGRLAGPREGVVLQVVDRAAEADASGEIPEAFFAALDLPRGLPLPEIVVEAA
jgi:hypothetical protein